VLCRPVPLGWLSSLKRPEQFRKSLSLPQGVRVNLSTVPHRWFTNGVLTQNPHCRLKGPNHIVFLTDLNWSMGAGSIAGTRARDADVNLHWPILRSTFDIILAIRGKRDMYLQLLHEQPEYFDVVM
jgi:hypothetical protein